MEQAGSADVTVTARWPADDDLPVHFANQFVVQHDVRVHEFYLGFGTVVPPAILGDSTDLQTISDLQKAGSIPIRPIVRVGLSPQRLLELITTLQTNYRNYQANLARLSDQQEEQRSDE